MSAVQLQWAYLEAAKAYVEDRYGADVDADTAEVLTRWEQVLGRLETDVFSAAREVDWIAKLRLLEGYRSRDGLDWDNARLQAVDLQWSDVRAREGPAPQAGRARPGRDAPGRGGVRHAVDPPRRTPAPTSAGSAWRGTAPGRRRELGLGDLRRRRPRALQRVPTLEPLRGTREHVGALLDRCETAEDLVAALTG